MGAYAIPLLFLAPGDSTLAGTTDTVVQQLDILPSVLDYLGYEKPFFAFGNSIFRPAYPRFVINRLSGSYNWYMDGYLLVTKALEPAGLYQFGTDSLCKRNILTSGNELANKTLIPYFRAFVQQYRSALIRNQMYTTRAGG